MSALKFRLTLLAALAGIHLVWTSVFDATVGEAFEDHAENSKAFVEGDMDALPAPDGRRMGDRLGSGRHDEFAAERARFQRRMEEVRRIEAQERFYDGFSEDSSGDW